MTYPQHLCLSIAFPTTHPTMILQWIRTGSWNAKGKLLGQDTVRTWGLERWVRVYLHDGWMGKTISACMQISIHNFCWTGAQTAGTLTNWKKDYSHIPILIVKTADVMTEFTVQVLSKVGRRGQWWGCPQRPTAAFFSQLWAMKMSRAVWSVGILSGQGPFCQGTYSSDCQERAFQLKEDVLEESHKNIWGRGYQHLLGPNTNLAST